MKMTRRAFSSLLCAAGASLGGMAAPRAATLAATNVEPRGAAQPQGLTGYPLRMKAGRPVSGWCAAPGETVYFALSHDAQTTVALAMVSTSGDIVHSFGEITIEPQSVPSGSSWSHGVDFEPTLHWAIPEGTPSGVYFLNELPNIFVVVRELSNAHAPSAPYGLPTAVLVPTNTISAYSPTAGRDFYSIPKRAAVLSFLRPFDASEKADWSDLLKFVAEERIFGAPRYLVDHDMENPDALAGVKLLIVDGHSEYWSRRARENFDRFIAGGGHALIAGGNVMWWQVRYGDSGNQLICYKNERLDPIHDPALVTVNWTDPKLGLPTNASIGGDFRHGGYGRRAKGANVSGAGLRIVDNQHPLLLGLGLKHCEVLDLGGVSELDGAPILGFDVLGRPVPDLATLKAYRLEILAWDWGQRSGKTTVGTAHIYQRSELGGTVLHLGAKECCQGTQAGHTVMRALGQKYAQRIYHEQPLFSGLPPAKVYLRLRTPHAGLPPDLPGTCA